MLQKWLSCANLAVVQTTLEYLNPRKAFVKSEEEEITRLDGSKRATPARHYFEQLHQFGHHFQYFTVYVWNNSPDN